MKKAVSLFACMCICLICFGGCTSGVLPSDGEWTAAVSIARPDTTSGEPTSVSTSASAAATTTTAPTSGSPTSGTAAPDAEPSGKAGKTTPAAVTPATEPAQPAPEKDDIGIDYDSFIAGGFANNKDGWTYYSGLNAFYKQKDGETASVKLTDGRLITNINVMGDWLYYLDLPDETYAFSLYRMKTDGSQKQKLYTTPTISTRFALNLSGYLLVTPDYIFLKEGQASERQRFPEDEAIYRFNLDGTGKKRICTSDESPWYYYDGRIYAYEKAGSTVFSVDINGENQITHMESVHYNWTLYDGFNAEDYYLFLILREDYFICQVYNLEDVSLTDYKVRYDGTSTEKLSEPFEYVRFPQLKTSEGFKDIYWKSHCIQIDDKVYYISTTYKDVDQLMACGTVNLDGSNVQEYSSVYLTNPMDYLTETEHEITVSAIPFPERMFP